MSGEIRRRSLKTACEQVEQVEDNLVASRKLLELCIDPDKSVWDGCKSQCAECLTTKRRLRARSISSGQAGMVN